MSQLSEEVLASGWLNLYKSPGISSAAFLSTLKRLTSLKVGHAGTLDPLARGVLPVALGCATRLIEYLSVQTKEYEFTVLFGQETDTGDTSGKVIGLSDRVPSEAELEEIVSSFTGRNFQKPPAFCARKVNGRRAYAIARSGQAVDLPEREIFISSLRLISAQNKRATYKVECSTGTYVRSLAKDIAAALGTCAVVEDIYRTRVGPFKVEDCVTNLKEICLSGKLPLSFVLSGLQRFDIESDSLQQVRLGRSIKLESRAQSRLGVLYFEEVPVAVGEFDCNNVFQPRKVFVGI